MENKYTVEEILEKMFAYFNVSSVSELAKAIDTSPKAISNWKVRNSISAVKKKCRELGIFQEIFAPYGVSLPHSNCKNDEGLLKLVYLANQTLEQDQIDELKKIIKQFMIDSVA